MPQKHYIECPFCSGLVEAKLERQMICLECRATFTYDEKLQGIFADTSNLRLPIQGTVCTRCGLVQDERAGHCVYCGARMVSTPQ
ncbi:MAG: hypothetical protein LJE94_10890 [Deltaproteobacteria bacterium]|nr:hypothetical protein [Deltaproteobacteria bacterium]